MGTDFFDNISENDIDDVLIVTKARPESPYKTEKEMLQALKKAQNEHRGRQRNGGVATKNVQINIKCQPPTKDEFMRISRTWGKTKRQLLEKALELLKDVYPI